MKIFNYLRLGYRIPLALAWTLLLHWFIRARQLFHPGRRYTGTIGTWGAGLARIMGVVLHRRNERSGPMGDLIVSNHMGFLDVPVLLSVFPSVFMIKMSMRKVFYFGKALEDQGHVFVARASKTSRGQAREGLLKVLKDGDRIIVFPEGRASPGAERLPFKPFSFKAAASTGCLMEACVIDYLPDREMLKWDIKRGMVPQLVELFGRRRTDISVEFFPAEKIEGDPGEAAQRYQELIQGRLNGYDQEKQGAGGPGANA